MSLVRVTTAAAVGLIGVSLTTQASAQSADAEIAMLKQQLRMMEQKLDKLQKQTSATATVAAQAKADAKVSVANANAAIPVKAATPFPGVIVKMPGNRPTICTADGANCVALTSRLHFDAATYDYRPNSLATSPQALNNGINARRARLGVVGTFQRDWDFGLILDGGGTNDGAASLNQAYIAYRGLRDYANLTIEGGYIDVPYTLDEATSSNNIMFMERAAPNVIATSINAGDSRSAVGVHANQSWWWAGAYLTGPATGTSVANGTGAVSVVGIHSNRQPVGATGRFVVTPINDKVATVLIGGDAAYLSNTGGTVGGVNTLTLSDRIEVRVDPSSNGLLSTGALGVLNTVNVDSARVLSAEAAVGIGSFYAQGEYYDYNIQRSGASDLNFSGFYGQASYVLTGESRKYSAGSGAFGGINPKNPVEWATGGYGAWEIAGRYSTVDLNDINNGIGANAVRGGELRNITLGVNWYATENIRFMFNWINGKVDKRNAANVDIGGKYDVFAGRMQFAF
jgi:phosphate-selective porin OprO/OprP